MILQKELINIIDRFADITRNAVLGSSFSNDDLAKILNDVFNIKIYYSDTDKFDGYLGLEDDRNPMIVLNKRQPKDRQLFTLAHELGHLVLHYNYIPGLKEDAIEATEDVLSISGYHRDIDQVEETTDPLELQANQFAGSFLMPTEEVKELVKGMDSLADKVGAICKNFGVSKRAAKKRLEVLEEINEVNNG